MFATYNVGSTAETVKQPEDLTTGIQSRVASYSTHANQQFIITYRCRTLLKQTSRSEVLKLRKI